VVERCLGSILIFITMWIVCNAPCVALLHAFALAIAFFYMNSGGLERTGRMIHRKVRVVPFRWRQRTKWVVKSTESKLVDCYVWFKSWLKCNGRWWIRCNEDDLEVQRKYSRRNQLKKSLVRCNKYKSSGRLMAIRFLSLTCFSAIAGTEAFCQPCCASTVVFEAATGTDGKPFSNAWDSDSGRIGVDC
jgi:hypothetical protein